MLAGAEASFAQEAGADPLKRHNLSEVAGAEGAVVGSAAEGPGRQPITEPVIDRGAEPGPGG